MSTDSSKEPKEDRKLPRKRWYWRRDDWGIPGAIFWGMAALLVPPFVIQLVIPLLLLVLPFSQNTQLSVIVILMQATVFLAVAALVKMYHRRLRDIGFGRIALSHVGKALLGYGVYIVVAIGLFMVTTMLPIDQEQPQELGYQGLSSAEAILAFIVIAVLTPIVEEAVFRGFMFRGLRRRLPFWPAALIVSVLFGIVHGQWNVGIDVFAMSMVACYLREVSGSLWPAIFLHVIKNSVAFSYLYFYNGL